MDRLLYAIENDVKIHAAGARRLQAAKLLGSRRGHWLLFYALLLTAVVFVSGCMMTRCVPKETQPVFFSMLFPQLVPEFAAEEEKEQGSVTGKAVML